MAAALLVPSAVILGVFVLYPLGRAVWQGQQRCNDQATVCRNNGWDQYVDVARSDEFQQALLVSVKFALLTVPLGLALGIGLAMLADKYLRGVGAFRTIFSSTVATSVAVASLMWLFLLEPSVGALSNIGFLNEMFPVLKRPGALNDPGTALSAVAVSSTWANLGFTFIIVTAGLQGIPRDLHEAAAVDGAGGIRRFWNITLPLLGPTMLFLVVVLSTRAFQVYGEIDLLTEGGPSPQRSTTNLPYLIFGSRSVVQSDAGLKATVSVLLFLVLLVLSVVQLRIMSRRVSYGQ
jgi:ABC-type sugar transport system permease subunit